MGRIRRPLRKFFTAGRGNSGFLWWWSQNQRKDKLSGVSPAPDAFEHTISYDLSWLGEDVNNWVAKITEQEVPAEFWTNVGTESNIAVATEAGTILDTYVAHFDDVAEELTVYAKVPTMLAGVTNTIKLVYGGNTKSNKNTTVFSDYILVQDVEKNRETDATGLLSTVEGATAGRPTTNSFLNNYYYFDVSAHSADFANLFGSTIIAKINSSTAQGDAGGLREGTSGNYTLISIGDVSGNHYFQSYKAGSWLAGESSGYALTEDIVFGGSIYGDSQGTGLRYIFAETSFELSEAFGTEYTDLDRFALGNASDRTSFDFIGDIFEVRLTKSITQKAHYHLNNFGLNHNNITFGSTTDSDITG